MLSTDHDQYNHRVYDHILWTHMCPLHGYPSWDSMLVRVWDSRSKGCKFESQQKRWENFLLESQLCVLTLTQSLFNPCVTAVACKRPRSFCLKCRWQVTPRHTYTHDPMKSGWADYATVQADSGTVQTYPESSPTQLVRDHSSTVVSARWATVDWSWPKEWN